MRCFTQDFKRSFLFRPFYMGVANHVETIGGISNDRYHELLNQKLASFICCIKIYMNVDGVSDLLKWTGRTLKRIESVLVPPLKYDRKISVEEQLF